MIAHNEANNLARSLPSVVGWTGEIIVVINDCTDATREVALQFGARVEERPWTCRRDQKNLALDLATLPWVLALDADEVVSPELKEEMIRFIQSNGTGWAGARFPRRTWFMGRWITHGDWYPDYNLRLFRRTRGRWGGSREHDKLQLDGPCITLAGHLDHYSFPSLLDNVRKIPDFAEAFASEQIERGRRWSLFQTLVRPIWRFFRCYILRRGFLDGFPGFYIAIVTALYTFIRYARWYEKERLG
ncbi:MAG: glycosyltransferase family 2 protein [Candidatus Methylacidiphilales bacterium]